MISFALAKRHSSKFGLNAPEIFKFACFRGFSARSSLFVLDCDCSDDIQPLSDPGPAMDHRATDAGGGKGRMGTVGRENEEMGIVGKGEKRMDAIGSRKRLLGMEEIVSILNDRGWCICLSDESGRVSEVYDSKLACILDDLFGLSSDASLTYFFFRMCVKHVPGSKIICAACTMICILVRSGRNYHAMDLIRSVVCCGKEGEGWVGLIIDRLGIACKREDVLETVYSMLFKCCVDEHVINSASDVIRLMKLLKSSAPASLCNYLLRILLESKQADLAWEAVDEMQRRGTTIGSRAVDLFVKDYCAKGSFSSAVELFASMDKLGWERDVVIYTTMIDGVCKKGYVELALSLYYKMIQRGISPDLVSITSLIDGYCKLGKWTEAMNLLRLSNCSPDVYVFNCFLSKMCCDGNIMEASKVFCEMLDMGLHPDAFSFTTMIGGFCKINALKQALIMFCEMLKRGFKPALCTYTVLIGCYARNGDLVSAECMLNVMKKEGLNPDVATYNFIIDALCKCGLLHKAYKWISIMRNSDCSPDITTYNILIHGLISRGYANDARDVLLELRNRGFSPDLFTFTNMIKLNSKEGNLRDAYLIWSRMSENGFEPDVITCSALVHAYCKDHQMEEALDFFSKMLDAGLKPDLVLFNTIIWGFCMINNVRDACELIHMMVGQGILPNNSTFRALVCGVSRRGIDNAAQIAAVKIRNILVENEIILNDSEYTNLLNV